MTNSENRRIASKTVGDDAGLLDSYQKKKPSEYQRTRIIKSVSKSTWIDNSCCLGSPATLEFRNAMLHLSSSLVFILRSSARFHSTKSSLRPISELHFPEVEGIRPPNYVETDLNILFPKLDPSQFSDDISNGPDRFQYFQYNSESGSAWDKIQSSTSLRITSHFVIFSLSFLTLYTIAIALNDPKYSSSDNSDTMAELEDLYNLYSKSSQGQNSRVLHQPWILNPHTPPPEVLSKLRQSSKTVS